MKSFVIVGQDERQLAALEFLKKQGYPVSSKQHADAADFVIFPMPFSRDRKKEIEILKGLPAGTIAFGGKIAKEVAQIAEEKEIILLDYLKKEELARYNAIPTAEGALQIIMENRKETLWKSRICVLGYGRIGKLLCRLLSAFGAEVVVAERKAEKRAEAESMGVASVSVKEIKTAIKNVDVIINTIPAQILSKEILQESSQKIFVLDLASMPGGIEQDTADMLGDRYCHALSIPARYAPVTAGIFIAGTVLQMIKAREADHR